MHHCKDTWYLCPGPDGDDAVVERIMTRQDDINVHRLHERLVQLMALKDVPRAGWVRAGVSGEESVAGHSWGVTLLAALLCPEGLDRNRVMTLGLIHDLAELIVGDITPYDGVAPEEKSRREREAMGELTQGLPNAALWLSCWEEYEAGESAEAVFVKACDKLEMALTARHYATTRECDTSEFIASALERLPPGILRALAAVEDA